MNMNKFSQEKTRTNLEIFEETISAELEKFYYYPGINREQPFIFIVNREDNGGSDNKNESRTKFLTGLIKKTASSNNLKFSIADSFSDNNIDSSYNLMILQVLKLETRYTGFKKNKFLGEKTLSRNIIINIKVELKAAENTVNVKNNINHNITDETSYDDYKLMESPVYDFTQAEAPSVSSFERIIFPVLLICITAAATILFFTIRSK
jgi:hypothetical protein